MKIYARVSRGPQKGEIVEPHFHDNKTYVLSPTRFAKDYVRVTTLEAFADGIQKGLNGRMSSSKVKGPRLFSPSSITVKK